jgi:predicted MFS family arabinose efflux permease
MKPQAKARLIVAVIAILISTWFSYHYRTHAQQIGRDAYLAEQAKRYDHMLAHPSLIGPFVASVVFWGGVFIVYEGVATAISKLLSGHHSDSERI